jgi:glucose-6-phosphate dehydrogenase assembly protein OpcA
VPDIKVADIEKELDKLWKTSGQNRVRASLFNLVVYSQDASRTPFLQEIIKATIEKFPCRILFIQCDPNPSADHFRVKASDELTKIGDASLACDYIIIEASMQQLHRVPYIIIPHLLPDLPLYLLWGQDPTAENKIFPQLQPFASRLIFDSDCVEDLPQLSRNILELTKTHPHLEIIDINWVRGHDWREALRLVFNSEKAMEQLSKNRGIQIRYNSKGTQSYKHPELQSQYLVKWLAAQLGWKESSTKQSNGQLTLTYKKDQEQFTAVISPQENSQLAPGTIVEVEIAGNTDYCYLISPVPNMAKVYVHISSSETCELPYTLPMPSFKKGFPCIAELLFDRTSNHYKNMLQMH